jgi:PleD family two-component response regulator
MLERISDAASLTAGRTTQTVVVVNGSQEMLELLQSVLDTGHYNVVFVAESEHAYSQIKQNRPNLVILCVSIDDPMGFQTLSMLKLDEETADIPILTYTNEFEGEATVPDADEEEDADDDLHFVRRELTLN